MASQRSVCARATRLLGDSGTQFLLGLFEAAKRYAGLDKSTARTVSVRIHSESSPEHTPCLGVDATLDQYNTEFRPCCSALRRLPHDAAQLPFRIGDSTSLPQAATQQRSRNGMSRVAHEREFELSLRVDRHALLRERFV
jgi:hypothetical protein